MSNRARILVKSGSNVEVYIKIKDGRELDQETLEYIAERAVDTFETDPTEELLQYFEENCEEDMIQNMCAIDLIIVDWPNMPEQVGWKTIKIDIMKDDEKANFYQSQYNERFNA